MVAIYHAENTFISSSTGHGINHVCNMSQWIILLTTWLECKYNFDMCREAVRVHTELA
jgi:hypothetical protein